MSAPAILPWVPKWIRMNFPCEYHIRFILASHLLAIQLSIFGFYRLTILRKSLLKCAKSTVFLCIFDNRRLNPNLYRVVGSLSKTTLLRQRRRNLTINGSP